MNAENIKWIFCLVVYMVGFNAASQDVALSRVEPPFWWTGMKEPIVQLLVYGKNISTTTVSIHNPNVVIEKITSGDSKNYVFIDLKIKAETSPGILNIDFSYGKKKKLTYPFELKERTKRSSSWGIDQQDVIYLVTPDRFVNGDVTNDVVKNLKEGINRSLDGGRHGGDLQGVIAKIPYMKDLGITSLWLNPVLENDMPEYSYHGYAITDYYKVDPRYGFNELYRTLSDELHRNNLKLINDMVFNHCGLEHWWMKDLPFNDWIHSYPDYKITNHAIGSFSDPHAMVEDQRAMEQGWFVSQMPDLNQRNPFMATYLIQNSIWWIEFAGLDGIRMDTYPYNQEEFMATWAKRVYEEYPGFYLVGETWVDNTAQESFWSDKSKTPSALYNSNLSSITDFPLCFALHKAFQKEGDLMSLYNVLSKDFLYERSETNTIFADNHDMDRFFYTIDGNPDKFKLAMTFLLTTRGIPQLYYGTEILMKGHGPHGIIREDFPGGWSGDARDAFTSKGRTREENEAYEYLKELLHWRKGSDAIAHGELKHFVPYNNLYVYMRKSDKESVVIVINSSDKEQKIDRDRFSTFFKQSDQATDVITGRKVDNFDNFIIAPNTSMVLHLDPKFNAD